MKIFFGTTIFGFVALVGAIPASPRSWTAHQPDGNSSGANQKLVGSPLYSYSIMETSDNFYTTIMDPSDGYMKYAVLDEETGHLKPSEYIVGHVNPSTIDIEPGLVESPKVIEKKCNENEYCRWHKDNNGRSHADPPSGSYKNLVVPFKFAGQSDRDLNVKQLDKGLFNGNSHSVKDYFKTQSYEKLNVKSTIVPEVTISKTEAWCADQVSGLSSNMHECLKEALAGKDTSKFDTVTFVHSGYGAEYGAQDEYETYYTDRIWSHSWEIEADEYQGRYALFSAFYGTFNGHSNRLGVAVHEIAQAMGAPTLYGNAGSTGYGLGFYDVMANPWGFDGLLENCGSMSAYSKLLFEWVTAEEISEDGIKHLDASTPKVYKISDGFPTDEYLLIESRQASGYDQAMRQPGLAMYHVDEAANDIPGHPNDGHKYPFHHYRVALIQADGRFDLERSEDAGDIGDLFHGDRFAGIDSKGPFDRDGNRLTNEDGQVRTFPNTNAYQGGNVRETGLVISDISPASQKMEFAVTFSSTSSS